MINSDNNNNGMGNHGRNGFSGGGSSDDSGVIPYLAELGIEDADLAKVAELLEQLNKEDVNGVDPNCGIPSSDDPNSENVNREDVDKEGMDSGNPPRSGVERPVAENLGREELIRVLLGQDLLKLPMSKEFPGDTVRPVRHRDSDSTPPVRLYVAESQFVLKEAYRSYFDSQPSFKILGYSSDTSDEFLRTEMLRHQPDVILLGLKSLRQRVSNTLGIIKEVCPKAGLVLLYSFYDAQGIQALREFSNTTTSGYAYLLKHNIDIAEQLGQVIHGLTQKRIVVDPEIMELLVDWEGPDSNMLAALTPKEVQALCWLAKGFSNEAIAGVLSRDRKAVERQVSSIYSKWQMSDDGKDPRVGSALMYLKATGMLTAF